MNKEQINYTVKKIETYNEKIKKIDKSTYIYYALFGAGVGISATDMQHPGMLLAGGGICFIMIKELQKMMYRNKMEELEDRLEMNHLEAEEKSKQYVIK